MTEPSAHEWLRRLEARELSAVELATHYLARLEAENPRLNAVAAVRPDAVLAAAAKADEARAAGGSGALLGLPVTIKDTIAVAGLPCASGSLARRAHIATEDATAVARLRAAGAVVLAKTAVPEYAWSYETESLVGGRTLSPFDPERTAGGSSGGEGALLGADASPIGIGTDGGGSIRVPSHYCGVVGIRPSTRLVPETGCWPSTRDTGMLDMSCIGPLGRTVDDVALVLGLIAGGDGIDPFVGAATIGDHRSVDPAALRVGFYTRDGVWPPTVETEAAVSRAAHALADRGAHVEQVEPPPLEEAADLFFRMMAADGGARARADLAPAGDRHTEQMLFVLDLVRGYALSAEGFFALLGRWSAFRSRLQRFVGRYDIVISPVAPGPAPLHGCVPGVDTPIASYLPWANVQAYSIGGLPVAVVPVGIERGLPLGVQIAASSFRDHVALAAAAVIEESTGGYAGLTSSLLPAPA